MASIQNINTYKDLKDSILAYLNRSDQATIDMLPQFVNYAEKQFTRLVKLPYYESMLQFTITDQFKFIVLPQDLLSVKYLVVNGVPYDRTNVETFLRIKNAKIGSGAYAGIRADDGGADPSSLKVFTRIGEQVHFSPVPKTGDLVELIYAQDIPEMQFDDDQPYSLLIAPDVLLYLALRHASIWLRDQEQEQYWNVKAQEAAQAVMMQLEEAEWSGSTLVVPFFAE